MRSKNVLFRVAATAILCAALVASLSSCTTPTGPGQESGSTSGSETETEERIEYNASEQSIFVRKDGTVTETTRESFQSEYYTLDELKTYIGTRLDEYNGANKAPASSSVKSAVNLDSLEMDGTDVVLKLTYATAADYLKFNKTYQNLPEDATLTIQAVDSASAPDSGVKFTAPGKSEKVEASAALSEAKSSKKTCYYVSSNIVGTIYLEGRILYLSDQDTQAAADSKSVAFTPVPIEKETQKTLIPTPVKEPETEKKPLVDADGTIIDENTEGAENEGFTEAVTTEEETTQVIYETRADLSRSISEESVYIIFK